MKVIALNGSPLSAGNTSNMILDFLDILDKEGVETEEIQLYGKKLEPCNSCLTCELRGDGRCADETDDFNDLLNELRSADGILLASPGYAGSVTGKMKIFLERAQFVAEKGDAAFRGKIGAAMAVSEHDGAESTYRELVLWMLMAQMTVVGSYPLPVFRALSTPAYANDKLAVSGLRNTAENMLHALGISVDARKHVSVLSLIK